MGCFSTIQHHSSPKTMKTTFDHSKGRFRVSYQDQGEQRRKFFRTEAEADEFLKSRKEDVREFGIHWHNTWTPRERAEIFLETERLRKAGWTLRSAVDFVLNHGTNPPAVPLETVARDFLNAKQAAGCRPRYLSRLRASVGRFLAGRREKPIADITPAEIREYISRNGWGPRTARGYLCDVQTLFSFAVRNRYCRENVAEAVDKPRLEDKPPGILTVPQSAALVNTCQRADKSLLATIVICLFAGVRPEEARRMEWANIGPDFLEVTSAKSKTRRRRLVPLTPQLRAWLDLARALGSELPARNVPDKFNRVRRLAGLFKGWPHDAMRHSFASYHLAKHRNENETALVLGNSPQMIFSHYREVVRPDEAEKFFGILPGNAASLEAAHPLNGNAVAVAVAKRNGENRGSRTATKAALAAVFQNGARTLPRGEVIRELCDVHGLAASTAYAALSPQGRFREHLREADGVIAWNSFPERPRPGVPANGNH
jgi:integrase